MKKGTKKHTPQIYKGPDYILGDDGIEYAVPGSPEYYSVHDLAAKSQRILREYGFKLPDLMNTSLGRDYYDTETFADKWGKSNIYRYFSSTESSVCMPIAVLTDLPEYMRSLKKELHDLGKRNSYLSRVDELSEQINRYCLESGVFSDNIQNYLGKQSTEKLLRFLKSIYVLQLSEETWCYWLCYSTLNSECRQNASHVLSACTGLLPHYDRLFSLYFSNRERDIAFQHLVLTAEEKCSADEGRLKEALIDLVLSHCAQFADKFAILKRVQDFMEFVTDVDEHDWSILLTYAYLCEKQKIKQAGDYVISAMDDETKRMKKCPYEVSRWLKKRFVAEIEQRENEELEDFLAEEETEL